MGTLANGADKPLFDKAGTVPDVSGAMQDYFQFMVFTLVSKTVAGFQVVETALPINFRGIIQSFSGRQLNLKPEGQRAWSWYMLHSDPSLTLEVDDVVLWRGKQTRVMFRSLNELYGFVEYHLVQDWEGSVP